MTGQGYNGAPPDPRPAIGAGMLGYGFMGKAHSNALRTLPVGEIASVSTLFTGPVTTPARRHDGEPVEPDDTVAALALFENDVAGTIDASLVSRGRRNMPAWEINCARGTLAWDLEDLNKLKVYAARDSRNYPPSP